jgi:hypothetical protein
MLEIGLRAFVLMFTGPARSTDRLVEPVGDIWSSST